MNRAELIEKFCRLRSVVGIAMDNDNGRSTVARDCMCLDSHFRKDDNMQDETFPVFLEAVDEYFALHHNIPRGHIASEYKKAVSYDASREYGYKKRILWHSTG